MDPNLPQTPSRDPKSLLILILVLGLVGAVMATVFVRSTFFAPVDEETIAEQEEQSASRGQDVIIYGVWQGQRTVIKAYNLQSGNTTALARLSDDSKKVTILSPEKLLYIKDTDARDHGKELAIYTFGNKKSTSIYKADEGFGIDDYVVSPDGKYIAVWEVRFPQNSGILRNGSSRVYTAEIGKSSKNRLYDEVQIGQIPVHYPSAITNTGEVFLDTFLPNSGAGWAYGMSVSNFQGIEKQDLQNMQNGTYGTQPTPSSDGRYLVFAGYDGTLGSGAELVNGARRAIIRANTIELLDTQTKLRQKLAVPNTSSYDSVRWDKISGNILFLAFSKIAENEGTFTYDLVTNQAAKVNLGKREIGTPANTLVSSLSNGDLLVGTLETSESALGNLGESYGAPYSTLGVIGKVLESQENPAVESVKVKDGLVQLITVVPIEYFPSTGSTNKGKTGVAAAGNNKNGNKNNDDEGCGGKDNIQLCLFTLKSELAPRRLHQQSDPDDGNNGSRVGGRDGGRDGGGNGGRDGGRPDLPRSGGTQPQNSVYQQAGRQPPDCGAHISQKCDNAADKDSCTTQVNSPGNSPCNESPLYLYGPAGQQVKVTVNTHVYNSNAGYDEDYRVILLSDDKLKIGEQVLDSIDYNYNPGIKRFERPTYGTIVAQKDLAHTLSQYALRLGLNSKETADLVSYGKKTLTAPYIFVSFFDQKTSEQLLPLSFTPHPDNYLNVVFYFKQLSVKPAFTPVYPVFKPFTNREGLTAVEISAIVE